MFKAQIIRRNFSLFRRPVSSTLTHTAAHHGHETIKIQRVRFLRPAFTRRKLLKYSLYLGSLYGIWRLIPEEEEEEEDSQQQRPNSLTSDPKGEWRTQQEYEEEDEGPEPILFLPTGFARLQKQEYYKGSDPEWKEFSHISRDKEFISKIQADLATIVRRTLASHPTLALHIGRVNERQGPYWLEPTYPDGPSPEYEQPGIEIDEDLNFRRTTRHVSNIDNHRLNRIIWPAPVAAAMLNTTKETASWGFAQLKNYFTGADNNTSQEKSPRGVLNSVTSPQNTMLPPSAQAAALKRSTLSDPLSQSSPSETTSPVPSNDAPSKAPYQITIKVPTVDLGTFHRTMVREWKPPKPHIPRGSFIVEGPVKVQGTKGAIIVDVLGIYDPKLKKYTNITMQLRRVKANSQTPRGGP
ncbi:hypothetical protein GQ43DRAFT_364525 [Delitschia confertaspora ATCC 74209]|uniref:Uncharacterized protein n=1 Tax=Delitschia confertaspora ATCC 74209 TaxID=1513339 RepID=A0A9P4MSR2_9PLEO|nr:hypothetical protein GQ43DRAFT_364525 [Delitschia confertaspora ATCC 74209]